MEAANPTPEGHQHRSARERQRRGPMWGCLRWLFFISAGLLVILLLTIGGGWVYLGTGSFAGLIKLRIEKTLESKLGRDVEIGSVEVIRSRPARVILNDVRIANSPGAVSKHFATVKRVVIIGGIDSFWGRRIRVSRIDVEDPHMWFEVYPAGSKLVHNFPHWDSGPKSKYEIYRLELGQMFIRNGAFDFLDRRHDLTATSRQINSQINITSKENLYAGFANSPIFRFRVQKYEPLDLAMRAQFRYTPGVLELTSLAFDGQNVRLFAHGKLAPLTEGVYDLRVTSQFGLDRIQQIFAVQRPLEGVVALDTTLKGRQGTFTMAGGWVADRIRADTYELTKARGKLSITDTGAIVDVERASYGGGTIGAHYRLPQYAEPYPMTVDLRYNGISLEKLFSDWGIEGTGMRAGATGRLTYQWNKDRLLAGSGEGTAALARNATAFSNAKYPIALGGSTDFALDNGIVRFRRADLTTEASRVSLTGTLRIEDVFTDLLVKIHSEDFAELDRIGYNFALSAGKKTYELLGLGGAGDISGSIRGRLKTPQVVARIAGTGLRYNNVALGAGEIDLKYDGDRSVMTFDRAVFNDGDGRLAMTGTIEFPDRGPSPRFDLAIDATNYPIDRAIATVNLKLAIRGLGSGRVVITGTPEAGKATFAGLTVRQGTSTLRLDGSTSWLPGEGNVTFDLDIDARSFPVADIARFLDLGDIPVSGDVTGRLQLRGRKDALEGSGGVTVTNGVIYGEPVTSATADIAFTQGTMRATNVRVVAPAGTITGQAEFNLTTKQYNYTIESSSIDLSRLKLLSSLAGILGGNIQLNSTGAGTFDQPELVLTATLNQATLRGLNFPADAPPPTLYIAVRNGQLIVKGSVADILLIEGSGNVMPDGALNGSVQVRVTDLARALALSPNTAALPATGKLTMNVQLGGKLSSLEALNVDVTFPEFDVAVSEHQFVPARPLHISMREGRIRFEQFELALQAAQSRFSVAGFVELVGAKRIDLALAGGIEAALLQLVMPGSRADGRVNIDGGVRGTLSAPRPFGTAELVDAQMRFPGFPQLISNLNGTIRFTNEGLDIESLRATLGGGTIVAGGKVAMDGMKPRSAQITLQGTGVAIRYFEGLTIEGDFTVQLSGDTSRMALQGDVNVTRALYFRDIDFGTTLLNAVLSRRGITPIVSASWQDRVALNLHLIANQTLAVRNNLADVTGGGDIEVRGTLANPAVIGLVTLDEGGRVRFQNVDYEVLRGSINFQNPFRIDPYFDLTLQGRVSGGFSEIESGPIEVTVNITGTIDRMTPTITSDPPASDITLFSLLGFGALGNNTGSTPTGAGAVAAGSSLLATSISRLLGSRVLPFVDTFTYDPGFLDTTGDPGAKVTFEKRLSNTLRLIVVYRLTDHKHRELIDWQINPEWALQFTHDEPRNEWRLEARFRRQYEGRWVWGSRGRNPQDLFAKFHDGEAPTLSGPIPVPAATATATAPPPTAATATVPAPTGANVVSVSFRADSTFDKDVLTQHVAVKTGAPLSIRDVQSSIKGLYATGDFRDVRVETAPEANGVAVTFALFVNYRVADVKFEGLQGADRSRAQRDITFHVGDVFSLNAVDHSATAIADFLQRSGYLEATVDPETSFERERSRALVIFHVNRGERAKVGSVTIEGDIAPFTPAELIHEMRRGPGETFQSSDARSDADRMKRFMVRRDRRKADVRYLGETYDPATNTAALRYRATSGPIVKVALDGPDWRAVRRHLPFARNQEYSEDVIDEAANDMIVSLQQAGYFNAVVDVDEDLDGEVLTTTFRVRPGQKFKLGEITFSGNAKISDKELRSVVATAPTGGLRSFIGNLLRRPTGVTRPQLSSDRDAIEAYYRLSGFSEAVVATPVASTRKDGTLAVDFPVTEGPQTLVAGVAIEGTQQVPSHELPTLQTRPGLPLNPQLVRADVIALQTFYADQGNAEVQITAREDVSDDKTTANVTYVVAEGPKITVDDVIVRGNTYTHSNVILRQSQLQKDEPFSFASLLAAQRNLYRLGIFRRVEVQAEQAGTSVSDRNVVISVQEGRNLSVAGSVGFTGTIDRTAGGDRVSIIAGASFAHRNLFGTGRFLGLQLVGSHNSERQEIFLTYREPAVGRFALPIQATIFRSNNLRRGAHLIESGASVEASKVAFEQTRWSIRYEFRNADCRVQNKDDVCARLKAGALTPGFDRTIGTIKISSLTPTFFWDRRDDPLNPTRGFFTSASVQYAFPALGADAHFLKEFTQGSWYLPLTARTTLAVSGRLGLIQPQGRDEETGLRLPVPLTERFTAGGDTSHRAYALDLLGTICPIPSDLRCHATLVTLPDGVAPIGGNGVLISNVEYRFPIFSSLGGAVFADAGNTFADTKIRLSDLRYGVGAGLRYQSPLGPLRFDFGYKLKRQITGYDSVTLRPNYERPYAFFITIGYPF